MLITDPTHVHVPIAMCPLVQAAIRPSHVSKVHTNKVPRNSCG